MLCTRHRVNPSVAALPRGLQPHHLALQDASFTLVAGLADPSKLSLRSLNVPDDVLRHKVRYSRCASWQLRPLQHFTKRSTVTLDLGIHLH
jgi:hypothetical protein